MTGLPMPARIARLPRDRGYPVPWFVEWIDGRPDFRIVDSRKIEDAVRFDQCWICGQHRGRHVSFVLGPMCGVNRVSSEPPAHRDCAIYAARRCPFLANPAMTRRDRGKPKGFIDPPGVMIRRNPGVALVWTTRDYRCFQVDDGVLFDIGAPTETLWFAHGRAATRQEVLASIESGLPALRDAAQAQGATAVQMLATELRVALELIPRAESSSSDGADLAAWPSVIDLLGGAHDGR